MWNEDCKSARKEGKKAFEIGVTEECWKLNGQKNVLEGIGAKYTRTVNV